MTWPRRSGFPYHHPAVVPAGALITALVLAVVVGGFGGGAESSADQPRPTPAPTAAPPTTTPPPTTSPTPIPTTAPTFVAAPDGKPSFTVDADANDPLSSYSWKVLVQAGGKLKPRGDALPGQPNVPLPIAEPLVNRWLCVTVPDGWTVHVPAAAANLTPPGEDPVRTVCQGGWSDARAVPRELVFTAAKGP